MKAVLTTKADAYSRVFLVTKNLQNRYRLSHSKHKACSQPRHPLPPGLAPEDRDSHQTEKDSPKPRISPDYQD